LYLISIHITFDCGIVCLYEEYTENSRLFQAKEYDFGFFTLTQERWKDFLGMVEKLLQYISVLTKHSFNSWIYFASPIQQIMLEFRLFYNRIK